MAVSKVIETFLTGSVVFQSEWSAVFEYLAFFALYMCVMKGLKIGGLLKYGIMIVAFVPPVFLFFFDFFYFKAVSFVFLWIPVGIIISLKLYELSKLPHNQQNTFAILILFFGYFFSFCVLKISKLFYPMSLHVCTYAQTVMALTVFVIAALSFQQFKSLYEKRIRIYDFMPLYWKRVPLAAILFVVLISGLFLSAYVEVKAKKAVAANADNVISGISEIFAARLVKIDQVNEALIKTFLIKEAVNPDSDIERNIVDGMLESYKNIFKAASIFTLDINGKLLFTSEYNTEKNLRRMNFKNRPFFTEAKKNGKARVFTKDESDNKSESYYASSAVDNVKGVKSGFVVVKDSMNDFSEMLQKYNNIYIIDKNGIVLLSDKEDVNFKSLWSVFPEDGKLDEQDVFDGSVVTLQGEEFYVARKFINEDAWSIVYFMPMDSVKYARFISMIVVSGIVVIILLLFLIINQSNRLLALSKLHEATLNSVRTVAILSLDVEGTIVMWSHSAVELTGYTKEEILAIDFSEVMFDTNGSPLKFEEVITAPSDAFNEMMFKKKDGTMANILLNAVPQFSSVGKLIGFIFSGIDITYRKKIEVELEHQIEFLQVLLDNIPVAVYYKDSNMRLIGCNKAFEEVMETPKDEIIGKETSTEHYDKAAAEMSLKTDEETMRKMSSVSYEISGKFKKTGHKDLVFYKTAYKNLDGEFGGIIGVILDVTKEKAMQQERDRLQTSLIQQNKLASLGELAGGIAHELNNPLSIILGYAQVLAKNQNLDEEVSKGIKNIYEAAERSRGIVSNMLEFSRADTAKTQTININDLIDSTLLIIEKDLKRSGIEVEKNSSGNNRFISVNPMQIQQVLLNIILNAKDAMEDGGKLTIDTYAKKDKCIIDITDTGSGISKEQIDKLFEPFFTTKAVGKGTGLGLSISYGIIKAHNGEISVKSSVGNGTVFTIKLPLSKNN